MTTFWLSFAGEEGNRGVCIVDASDFLSAVMKTHLLGINPGGEIQSFEMPPEAEEECRRWGRDRLISPEELSGAGYKKISDLSDEERARFEAMCAAPADSQGEGEK